MGIKTFDAAEGLQIRQRSAQGWLVIHNDTGAALELVRRKAGETFSRTARGQFVARSGQEIARHHRERALASAPTEALRDLLRRRLFVSNAD